VDCCNILMSIFGVRWILFRNLREYFDCNSYYDNKNKKVITIQEQIEEKQRIKTLILAVGNNNILEEKREEKRIINTYNNALSIDDYIKNKRRGGEKRI